MLVPQAPQGHRPAGALPAAQRAEGLEAVEIQVAQQPAPGEAAAALQGQAVGWAQARPVLAPPRAPQPPAADAWAHYLFNGASGMGFSLGAILGGVMGGLLGGEIGAAAGCAAGAVTGLGLGASAQAHCGR